MSKISPFLICTDIDSNTEEEPQYILHTQFPRHLIEINPISLDESIETSTNPYYDLIYLSPENEIEIFRLKSIQNIDKSSFTESLNLLSEAQVWYSNILIDADFEEIGRGGSLLKDFSNETIGLKVIEKENKWLVISRGIIADFDFEEEMDTFLEQELGVPKEILDKGLINSL